MHLNLNQPWPAKLWIRECGGASRLVKPSRRKSPKSFVHKLIPVGTIWPCGTLVAGKKDHDSYISILFTCPNFEFNDFVKPLILRSVLRHVETMAHCGRMARPFHPVARRWNFKKPRMRVSKLRSWPISYSVETESYKRHIRSYRTLPSKDKQTSKRLNDHSYLLSLSIYTCILYACCIL